MAQNDRGSFGNLGPPITPPPPPLPPPVPRNPTHQLSSPSSTHVSPGEQQRTPSSHAMHPGWAQTTPSPNGHTVTPSRFIIPGSFVSTPTSKSTNSARCFLFLPDGIYRRSTLCSSHFMYMCVHTSPGKRSISRKPSVSRLYKSNMRSITLILYCWV